MDGFVSLEVSPLLAHDTAQTVAAAKQLHAKANKPNLFIKIPGTVEGQPATERSEAGLTRRGRAGFIARLPPAGVLTCGRSSAVRLGRSTALNNPNVETGPGAGPRVVAWPGGVAGDCAGVVELRRCAGR